MFGTLSRRVIEGIVGVFALLGFACVPLGSKTGLEHTRSFLSSPETQDAARGLWVAMLRAQTRISGLFYGNSQRAEQTQGALPELPESPTVRPVVPKLPGAASAAGKAPAKNAPGPRR